VMFVGQVDTLLSQAQPERIYSIKSAGMPDSDVDPRAHIGSNGPDTYVAETDESLMISEPARLLTRPDWVVLARIPWYNTHALRIPSRSQ
jgi:hypothetical protein